MFSSLPLEGEPVQAVNSSLQNILNNTDGLKIPSDPKSMDLLEDSSLHEFLNHGVSGHKHFLPDVRGKIARLFEMTQAWSEYRTHNDLAGACYCDPEPLSENMWQRFVHALSPIDQALSDCKNAKVLDRFARLLLTARKDWLEENKDKICEVPELRFVARIHSCLMVLKKREMLGYGMEVGEGDRWLAFTTCHGDINKAVQECENRYG